MPFTLSQFIYPIEQPILLSKTLKYSLDNARGAEELQILSDYLKPALEWGEFLREGGSLTQSKLLFAINKIKEQAYLEGKTFIFKAFEGDILQILSRCWVIIRYDDDGTFDRLAKYINNPQIFGLSGGGDEFLNAFYGVTSYGHLFYLLLINNEQYFGQTISLLTEPYSLFFKQDTENMYLVCDAVIRFTSTSNEVEQFGVRWNDFTFIHQQLRTICQKLENLLELPVQSSKKNKSKVRTSPKEKMLYIGDLLRIIHSQSHDLKVKFILLVSILELLITHSPDLTKNVEDSIRKQFVLKLAILLYKTSAIEDLNTLKDYLNEIYAIRSSIAHGNPMTESRNQLREHIKNLYSFVQKVFKNYLDDYLFVDFLKEN